jgi:glyoxylase-like metal-dependent hydrolase (beta-lactamase superfamily II)
MSGFGSRRVLRVDELNGIANLIEEVRRRLYRVVVPLPGNPLKEINSWVLTSSDRNLIIDTGMNRPECREVLEAGLAEIGVDLERTDLVATHLHADHQGLISTLLRSGSRAYMGGPDARSMAVSRDHWSHGSPMGDYAARSGFPADDLQASLQNHPGYKYGSEQVVDYVPLKEGDVLEVGEYSLEVVETPGHTDGHVCLYDSRLRIFFSGDHVLGDITPNIGAWTDDHDPLAEYLASLEKVNALDVGLCLPGHRSLIQDFRRRIAELIEHHRVRANEVISILERGPRSAYETAAQMIWRIRADSWDDFPIMQRWFAVGEAIAHLRYLETVGLIERETVDGQILYSTDGASRL